MYDIHQALCSRKENMESIILGYKETSCLGWAKGPGGWSFDVTEKGTVQLKTYLIDQTVTSSTYIYIPNSVIHDLQDKLQVYQDAIHQLPGSTNNGSCDGAVHNFIFLGKTITSVNISKYSEDRIQKEEAENIIDHAYAQVLRAENTVLTIFESVHPILKPYGLLASFDPYFSCQWKDIDPDKYAVKQEDLPARDEKMEIPEWMSRDWHK